ncbi:uncharacterized protein LOC62_04G006433 [Vanrija pseudolonga]|uniref:Rnh202 triple barrel domain-containing protein n=1 Tax=Vanrija pseudolonga TaxID=143232 RepID=A0AAF0YA46_9TREE|nr:hypothetical protein LOC62_04G006433 [Vanrija pseudolonga]
MTEYIAVIKEDLLHTRAEYLRLPHPRTGQPQLYVPHADGSLSEVSKVSGAHGRTWFIGDTIAPGSMLVHQPVDALFLAIPIALDLIPSAKAPAPFQPLPDLLATASSSSAFALKPAFSPSAAVEAYNADVQRLVGLKAFRRAFKACCDKRSVAAPPSPPPEGGESKTKGQTYYRPSIDAIVRVLRRKVDLLASPEQFGKFDHLLRGLGRDGLLVAGVDEGLVQAARNRAAIEHVAQYLPSTLLPSLTATYDFTALEEHDANRAAAAAAAAAPVVNEKKEKGGVKRKAPVKETSRGVEALKKVNTTGAQRSMMAGFFKPKK